MTLAMTFHVFFNVYLLSRSFPLLADWQKSDSSVDGEPQGNWRRNLNSTDVVASSPFFSRPAARATLRACSQASKCGAHKLISFGVITFVLTSGFISGGGQVPAKLFSLPPTRTSSFRLRLSRKLSSLPQTEGLLPG